MVNKDYQKHKFFEKKKEAHKRYENLSKEEKDKTRKKSRDKYENLPKEKKAKTT